jgi:hypothetical protein
MKKLFHIFRIRRSAQNISDFDKATSSDEKADKKAETKTYLRMPMAFDFTAYFDDNELENNAEDTPHENSVADTNIEVFCMNDEKSNEVLYSSSSQQFECCIN